MKFDNLNVAVILNGPPGCGKDTLANLQAKKDSIIKRQFKDALYAHTAKYFNVGLDEFIHFASDRVLKDSLSLSGLHGRTPRQALIHVSEDIYKPRYGSDYFGKVEADNIRELKGRMDSSFTVIYPDGGFTDEVVAIEPEFDVIVIVRLHRDGFDFSNDSRDYIYLPDNPKRTSIDLYLTDGQIEHNSCELYLDVADKVCEKFNGVINDQIFTN
ncbi:putative ATP-binding protein [Proteus phage Myduc]|uniref:Putative ATP-binding protein n=1 Tax=Proteus phage Myduc TaxID=2650874 RepID=A0A5J6T7L1_9CAUD|nr:putative ATP-binding protein [Proteus phage Myduc]QFG06668.1 putative ATP-binding protein [Proteus phage Myduc]